MTGNNEYLHTLKIENMKKLMILSAAALAIFLALPQFAEATTVQNGITMTQEKAVKYTEITVATLPQTVVASLTKDYSGYAIDKVFLGDDGNYKVAVSKGSIKNELIFSEKGELIKGEKAAAAKAVETPAPAKSAEKPVPAK